MFEYGYYGNENELNNYFENGSNFQENNINFLPNAQAFPKNFIIFNDDGKTVKENQNNYMLNNYYFINKLGTENNLLEKEEKSTFFKSKPDKEEIKVNEEPTYYSIHNILDLLDDDKFLNIRNKILSYKKYNNIPSEIEFSKKKKNNSENEEQNLCILIKKQKEENPLKTKRGRQKNNEMNTDEHDNMSPDNIIKKIKGKIFHYLIDFINNVINKKEYKLLKLDYTIINRLNREKDLEYLKMSLKDLSSKDISSKNFKGSKKDYNKKLIDYILKYEADITIQFMLNMTLGDWLDIYTLKKSVKQIVEKYDCLEQNIDCEKIEKSFIGIEILLNEICDKNAGEYFILFVFYLYNYERWFYIKNGRKRG